jgi:predicted signal transduction protein with EAL and GGDEF domain
MYHAKENGRNNSQYFKHEMNVRAIERQVMTGDLCHALARGEFMLTYQPKINLLSGAITGVEALIRWRHPIRGLLSPDLFIPIAEDCGLIIQIGCSDKPAFRRNSGSRWASRLERWGSTSRPSNSAARGS